MNRSLIAILVVTLSLAASVSCVRPAEDGAETDRPTVEAMLGLTCRRIRVHGSWTTAGR